jgi:hypothetical protein
LNTKNWTICIKVDTDAIARNGKLPKDGSANYEPAIIVLMKDESGDILSEERVHAIDIEGPVQVWQDDLNPGAVGSDGRGARVWVECYGKIETMTYQDQESPGT